MKSLPRERGGGRNKSPGFKGVKTGGVGWIILIQIELVVPEIITFLLSGPHDWDYKNPRVTWYLGNECQKRDLPSLAWPTLKKGGDWGDREGGARIPWIYWVGDEIFFPVIENCIVTANFIEIIWHNVCQAYWQFRSVKAFIRNYRIFYKTANNNL